MNCQNHPEVPATAYCRTCGKPLCDECRRDAYGTVYCAEHFPAPAAGVPPPPLWTPPPSAGAPSAPYVAPPPAPPHVVSDVSPGLAFFLGWIPGVGAIYNGQYAKGLVHAVIWGLLVSIINSRSSHGLEPVFGILIAVWEFYMAFEAYHTARRRRAGEPVDEYSSLIDLGGRRGTVPVAAIALIVLGVVLLLHTLDLLDFEYVARYWPVLLIAAGAWLLYGRITAHTAAQEGVRHERQ
jgi:TM2 domain-containing membrane protein YozV